MIHFRKIGSHPSSYLIYDSDSKEHIGTITQYENNRLRWYLHRSASRGGSVKRLPSLKRAKELVIADYLDAAMRRIADRLRETAAGVEDGSMHPRHTANRLRKMADEIAPPSGSGADGRSGK